LISLVEGDVIELFIYLVSFLDALELGDILCLSLSSLFLFNLLPGDLFLLVLFIITFLEFEELE